MGEGELRAEIEKQINELNLEKDIFLMGFQSNVYKYLKKAEVLSLFIMGRNRICDS